MKETIAAVLGRVTRQLYQEGEQRKKDAARAARAVRNRQAGDPRLHQQDIVFHVLPQALAQATGNGQYAVSARTLYYQVRQRIQPYTTKELDYNYFSQNLLTRYRQLYGEIRGLFYDPRGVLYEPHTGKEIKLGTQQVDRYQFPEWTYNKILYVEKKGLWPSLQDAQIAERYDLAVIAAEGYASEAARTLFAAADSSQAYQLFVLHDADPYGYNIARTLREETRRMPGYSVDVIDLGLHLADALELGLPEEEFTRKKALPAGLHLTETEQAYFVGKPVYSLETRRKSQQAWLCRRVELDAFPAPDLVAYIERKLREAGAAGKVIPSEAALPSLVRSIEDAQVRAWIETTLARRLTMEAVQHAVTDRFRALHGLKPRQVITEALEQDPALPWRAALEEGLDTALETHADVLEEELLRVVRANLDTDTDTDEAEA